MGGLGGIYQHRKGARICARRESPNGEQRPKQEDEGPRVAPRQAVAAACLCCFLRYGGITFPCSEYTTTS
ncbi:hypothetical protein E2C01_020888 [Portunus trituberculatus]|uniref:Uncharacterized protein n=1 Tax=Portunus trituberculatus TaxID=210409 RepID=A0A5B7E2T1_PORTR|nr:hypothetical protein [Portunus trituberculatus]